MFDIEYELSVFEDDIPKLPKNIRGRIKETIERKLTIAPDQFGKPLRHKLAGYWSLRVDIYRIIYTIDHATKTVLITEIGHRQDIYH